LSPTIMPWASAMIWALELQGELKRCLKQHELILKFSLIPRGRLDHEEFLEMHKVWIHPRDRYTARTVPGMP